MQWRKVSYVVSAAVNHMSERKTYMLIYHGQYKITIIDKDKLEVEPPSTSK
jgi:hypothetical protein